jgi:hypothetical protein
MFHDGELTTAPVTVKNECKRVVKLIGYAGAILMVEVYVGFSSVVTIMTWAHALIIIHERPISMKLLFFVPLRLTLLAFTAG